MNYQAVDYEHYHDHGDDAPPTIEAAVLTPTNTYITGFKNMSEAQNHADILNRYGKGDE